jgi:hypothetical protein
MLWIVHIGPLCLILRTILTGREARHYIIFAILLLLHISCVKIFFSVLWSYMHATYNHPSE